ncbi:ABC transporter permease [archaeon]|nr:ABC transporter permease [archaeon]
MISKELAKYSLRGLAHRKTRSFLTILSILLGIATIFIFISFGLGLYNYINEFTSSTSADKIIIQAKGGSGTGLGSSIMIDNDDVRSVERSAGVFEASGSYILAGEIVQGNKRVYVFLASYDPQIPLVIEFSNLKIELGRELLPNDRGKVVLGYNYLVDDKIFPKGYELNQNIEVNGEKMRIVGFYEPVGNPQDDSNIYITNDYAEELFAGENLSYGMIVARVDKKDIDLAVENVEKSLRSHRDLDKGKEDFSVQSFAELLDSYMGAMNIVIGFVILIALISVLVSAVNTSNTMITSVLERIKEIGIIKSIGGKNSSIFSIFLFESGVLGFVSGVLGVLLGWGLSSLGGNILASLGWSFLSPAFPASLFIGCILFATITGAISGVIPSWQASKINPVDALRYE